LKLKKGKNFKSWSQWLRAQKTAEAWVRIGPLDARVFDLLE
jgi:hypothetical protein